MRTEHLHIKVCKKAGSERARQTAQKRAFESVRGSHVSSELEASRHAAQQLRISPHLLPSTSPIPCDLRLLEFQFIPSLEEERSEKQKFNEK